MKKTLFLFALSSALLFSGCDKDEPTTTNSPTSKEMSFNLGLTKAGEPVSLNTDVLSATGFKLNLSTVKLYLSNIQLEKADGSLLDVKDVALFDLSDAESVRFVENIPLGNYTGVRFTIGLDAATNASDPTSFDQTHPLSNYQGMYWSMLKYRFAVIEGTANTQSGAPGDAVSFTYHTGTDPAMRSFSSDYAFSLTSESVTELFFNLDINTMLSGDGGEINPINESSTHSMPSQMPFTNKLMDNILSGFYVEAIYAVP